MSENPAPETEDDVRIPDGPRSAIRGRWRRWSASTRSIVVGAAVTVAVVLVDVAMTMAFARGWWLGSPELHAVVQRVQASACVLGAVLLAVGIALRWLSAERAAGPGSGRTEPRG